MPHILSLVQESKKAEQKAHPAKSKKTNGVPSAACQSSSSSAPSALPSVTPSSPSFGSTSFTPLRPQGVWPCRSSSPWASSSPSSAHPGRPIRLHPRPARGHAAHDSVHVLPGQQHQHRHGDITAPARCLLPLCGLQPHRRLRTDLPWEKRRLCLGRHLSLTTTIGGLVSPLVAGVLTSGGSQQPFKSSGLPPSSAPSSPSSSPSEGLENLHS